MMRFVQSVAVCCAAIMAVLSGEDCRAQPASSEQIVLQLPFVAQFQFAGYYAALDKGFYRDEGLNVAIQPRIEGKNPTDQVVSGEAQFGVLASEILERRLTGSPVVALAVIFQKSSYCLMSLSESGITKPTDLKGKRVMFELDRREVELRAMFSKSGISVDEFTSVPYSWELNDLVLAHIDAMVGYYSMEPNRLRLRGIPVSLIRPISYGVDFYGDTLFTSEHEVQEHPARVAAFRRASLKGWKYAFEHSDEVINLLVDKHSASLVGRTRELLRREAESMRELVLPDLVEMGDMFPDRWRKMADIMVEQGIAPNADRLKGFVYGVERPQIPPWVVRWLVVGLCGAIMIGAAAAAWSIQLRRSVAYRTRDYQESMRRLVQAQELGGVADWELDVATGALRWSDQMYRLLEIDPARGFGDLNENLKLFSGEERSKIESVIQAAVETGTPGHSESRLRTRDGREKILSGVMTPVKDASGRVTKIVGVTQDVTTRRLQEMEIIASEARKSAIMESALDCIITLDSDGRIVDFNPAAERTLGYAKADIVGKLAGETLVPARHRAVFRHALSEYVKTGEMRALGRRLETEAVRADGREIPVELAVTSSRVGDGPPFFTGYVRDISERRSAELRYRTLIDHAPDAIVTLDVKTGRFVDANPRACTLYGLSRKQLMTVGPADVSPPNQPDGRPSAESAAEKIQVALRGEIPVFRWDHKRPDGTIVPCEIRLVALPSDREHPLVRGSITDITDRLLAEETLKKRTAELERSNRELERFAYIASHDLQEPLRMVTSFTQLLSKRYTGQLSKEADEFIGFAVDGARRMQMLIDDLLAYSRAGRQTFTSTEVSTGAALDDALSNLRPTIEASGATITRGELPTLIADSVQFVQLFQNLIGNAIKFRGSDPPRIHVSAKRDDGGWVFSVQDNGIGIDSRHVGRLFVMFQRLHPRHQYPGSGIGLALCKMIVERIGGKIWVESEPGRGSTFLFTVPDHQETPR